MKFVTRNIRLTVRRLRTAGILGAAFAVVAIAGAAAHADCDLDFDGPYLRTAYPDKTIYQDGERLDVLALLGAEADCGTLDLHQVLFSARGEGTVRAVVNGSRINNVSQYFDGNSAFYERSFFGDIGVNTFGIVGGDRPDVRSLELRVSGGPIEITRVRFAQNRAN